MTAILEVSEIRNYLGGRWVHDGVSFNVEKGEIVAMIGASGCGKTTLLRTILRLLRPASGSVKVFDTDIVHCSETKADFIRKQWGVMFQSSALFSSLTLLDNVIFPLNEYLHLTETMKKQIAQLKISFVGLNMQAAGRYPAELSGGMKKRGAMARAIAADPQLVFLDEPTSGLDPESAEELDSLILYLRKHLGITFLLVTHDLDTLWRVPDRIVFLGEGKVLAAEPIEQLVKNPHPLIKDYFKGHRAKIRTEMGKA